MGLLAKSSFSDAPVMIMSPSADHQLPRLQNPFKLVDGNASVGSTFDHLCSTSYANHCSSWTPTDALSPISTNPSRKRSREDTGLEHDGDGSYFPRPQIGSPATIPEEEPINIKAVATLGSPTGLSMPRGCQGLITHEVKADVQSQNPPSPLDSDVRLNRSTSRKIARLLSTNTLQSVRDATSTVAPTSATKTSPDSPHIDDFTLALGIGWTRLSVDDPDVQAAARGWVRFLESHYPEHISEAQILLKSEGLNAYLVGCLEGFYLFNEDLLEGRLIGKGWDSCLSNLKSEPMAFEGQDVLKTRKTTVAEVAIPGTTVGPIMQGGLGSAQQNEADGSSNGIDTDGGMEID